MRIGVISDIHGNYAAMRTVLDEMGEVDSLWCLGDLVGYGPQPNECIEALLELPPPLHPRQSRLGHAWQVEYRLL